jgi:hypothetical protein
MEKPIGLLEQWPPGMINCSRAKRDTVLLSNDSIISGSAFKTGIDLRGDRAAWP